jgi:hypothetical protein
LTIPSGSGYCAVLKSTAQSAVVLGTAGIQLFQKSHPFFFLLFFGIWYVLFFFNIVTSVKQKLLVLFFLFFSLFHSQILSDIMETLVASKTVLEAMDLSIKT